MISYNFNEQSFVVPLVPDVAGWTPMLQPCSTRPRPDILDFRPLSTPILAAEVRAHPWTTTGWNWEMAMDMSGCLGLQVYQCLPWFYLSVSNPCRIARLRYFPQAPRRSSRFTVFARPQHSEPAATFATVRTSCCPMRSWVPLGKAAMGVTQEVF
jgi:hypothetical protein